MLVLLELDEAANPMHVRFFRASAVMADPQNSDEVVAETGRGFSLEQPQRLRSLSSRQHRIARLVRAWPFPTLEPLGIEGGKDLLGTSQCSYQETLGLGPNRPVSVPKPPARRFLAQIFDPEKPVPIGVVLRDNLHRSRKAFLWRA